MPRSRQLCRECGSTASETVYISRSGLCGSCGAERARAAAVSMAAHSGEAYERFISSRWPQYHGDPLERSARPPVFPSRESPQAEALAMLRADS